MRVLTFLVGLLAAALIINVMGHDAHGAEAVAAWHPQSTHEHGSLGQTRPYGMVAHSAGISENHEGFKQFKFMVRGDVWFLTVHQGTSGQGRVCTRFHEVNLKITRAGKLMADLAWLGDFGRAEAFEDKSALSPTTCPTQYADARAVSSGSRRISVSSIPDTMKPYEAWRLDTSKTTFGFVNSMAVNTHDFATKCPNRTCDSVVPTGKYGALRSVSMWVPASSKGFYLDSSQAKARGTFYTNAYGTTHDTYPSSADPVRQYIAPGAWRSGEYGAQGSCVTITNPFGDRVPARIDRGFVCGSSGQNMNLGQLQLPN